jgi:hypothetical protein
MALRCCIWNIDNMEPEALQWLRWSYASRLHDYLKLTWVEGRTEAQSAMANLSVQ